MRNSIALPYNFKKMNTQHYQSSSNQFPGRPYNGNNKIVFGILIITIGLIILSKRLGLFFLHIHVWPMALLALGIYLGVKYQFRSFGAWVLITLGALFMIPRFVVFGILSTKLVLPILLVLLGIYIILRPQKRWQELHNSISTLDDDTINLDVSFGERNAIVTSKNFKGGSINNTFGETKLSLTQADSNQTIVLNLKVSFGQVDILVPSHWDVEFQINNSFASVEDKRYLRVVDTAEKRQLILKGNCSFGSVTVKSV